MAPKSHTFPRGTICTSLIGFSLRFGWGIEE
jgi:hypothetical protein